MAKVLYILPGQGVSADPMIHAEYGFPIQHEDLGKAPALTDHQDGRQDTQQDEGFTGRRSVSLVPWNTQNG
jgi:hypothetical protein